ncbi:MAG: transporter substrate-binding domain-containing protein, partial [Lachnospiraceae bacterium]|nr:transporter substrate-binding domain-containing protein [Lachnospiraceae bacterium]
MRSRMIAFLAVFLLILAFAAVPSGTARAASDLPEGEFSSLDELASKRIGLPTGSNFGDMVAQRLPDAEVSWYNGQPDLLVALSTNKIDAFPADEPVLKYIMGE